MMTFYFEIMWFIFFLQQKMLLYNKNSIIWGDICVNLCDT